MSNITEKLENLSFFNYHTYSIPEEGEKQVIEITSGLTIIVRDKQLGDLEMELLTKILASVGQSLEHAQLVKLTDAQSCRLQINPTNTSQMPLRPLVLVFGLSVQDCSLQIEKRPYTLIQLHSKNILMAHALGELSSLNDAKRALWMALKEHFKKE